MNWLAFLAVIFAPIVLAAVGIPLLMGLGAASDWFAERTGLYWAEQKVLVCWIAAALFTGWWFA